MKHGIRNNQVLTSRAPTICVKRRDLSTAYEFASSRVNVFGFRPDIKKTCIKVLLPLKAFVFLVSDAFEVIKVLLNITRLRKLSW